MTTDIVKTLIRAGYNIFQGSWIMAHESNPSESAAADVVKTCLFSSYTPCTLQNFMRRHFKKNMIDCGIP
jgi:hypothetical protein